MSRKITLVLTVLSFLCVNGYAFPEVDVYSGATPTETYSWNTDDSGAYLIESEADLLLLSKATNAGASTIFNGIDYTGVTFRLTKDLDLGAYPDFQPIGGTPAFNGTFHGGGYVIRNLTINNGYSYMGLFAQVGDKGVVDSLGVETSVSGVKNTSSSSSTGILVGSNAGMITQCYAKGTVESAGEVGGLVGSNGYFGSSGGLVDNCYAIATVKGGGEPTGGLVGYNYMTIQKSYVVATVTGTGYKGSFLGRNRNSASKEFAGCYYEAHAGINGYGNGTVNDLTSLTAAQMKGTEPAPSYMPALDFINIWHAQTDDYPMLEAFYRLPTYEVSFEPVTGASASFEPGDEVVVHGSDFSFIVVKDAAYEAYSMVVTANGITLTAEGGVYTIVSVEENVVVSIMLVAPTYEVSFEPVVGASASFEPGNEMVVHGSDFSFTVVKDAAYEAYSVVVTANGITLTAESGVYTIASVEENVVVNITLVPPMSTTSSDSVAANNNSVWTVANGVNIELAEAAFVQIYNIQGCLVYNSMLEPGVSTISLSQGTYMVKMPHNPVKVFVKD